jgi:cell division septum initiation protein DivIVA
MDEHQVPPRPNVEATMDEHQFDVASADPKHKSPSFKIVWRGFDQEQVRAHLRLVGQRVSDLESQLRSALHEVENLKQLPIDLEHARMDLQQARREIEELQQARDSVPAEGNPFEGVAEHVMELVREFDRDVELLRRRAEYESTSIVAEARTQAATTRIEALEAEKEARAQAERLLTEARDEAAHVRAQLEPLREWTLSQAQAIRDRMRSSLLEFEAVMPGGSDDSVIVVEEAQEGQLAPGDGPGTRRGV